MHTPQLIDHYFEENNLESIIESVNFSEILLVIDGSMDQKNMSDGLQLLRNLTHQLRISSHPFRIGVLFYGEYNDIEWMECPWYIISYNDYNQIEQLIEQVEKFIAQIPHFRKAHCGALEYVLDMINRDSSVWRFENSFRHIVVIGTSPPHPTPQQRKEFQLTEHTIDEFSMIIDWLEQIDSLKSQQIQFHVFVPQPKASQEIKQYMQFVWKTLDPNYQIISEDIATMLSHRICELNSEPYSMSARVILPLLKPLSAEYI